MKKNLLKVYTMIKQILMRKNLLNTMMSIKKFMDQALD